LGGQAQVKGVAGTWKDLTDNVNFMANNLTNQVRNIAEVTTAVAKGDLSKKITVDVKGEILELKNTINTMVDQLSTFASEVTRVAREVGTRAEQRRLGNVRGVAGTWKELNDNVNFMAGNLTNQVRNIAYVTLAVANGDLSKKITVDVKGEILELKNTINTMVDQLSSFASEVTRVAREVGTEGILAGQAGVKGVAGTWKDLTDNVNQLAANLTKQVRAIAEVATAVTKGDLTRSITVEARGEVAALKDNINEMIRNLKDTTLKNSEQDWLKTNLAKFTRMLQGQRDLLTVAKLILSELAPVVGAQHGVFYMMTAGAEEPKLELLASYAYSNRKNVANEFKLGEGLVEQSQSLATELQSRQEELQTTNAELEEKATLLAEQNAEVERKNTEVEQARQALEEKASQLALTSKYKSEFLANMSHELRTPLNSLLILAEQLGTNPDGNLTFRQVDYAKTIQSAGNDLLKLINDILDLAKIESGTVTIDVTDVAVTDIVDYVERTFRPVAESRALDFTIDADPRMPAVFHTDSKRLQQVLRNLLSNAFKFTEHGSVTLRAGVAHEGWNLENDALNNAPAVVVFSVSDTGIGIQPEKQQIIFEA